MERTVTVSTPTKALAVFMAIVVALAFVPSPAYAASKTVKKSGFQTTTAAIEKKAATVKKGTTKLTFKKGQGYLKFKATKTKTYSFKFSNVKSKRGASAFVEVQTQDPTYPTSSHLTDVKTKGGKNSALWLRVNSAKSYGKGVNKTLSSRTGKIKLTQGQMVYFYFYNGSSKTTATLKIK